MRLRIFVCLVLVLGFSASVAIAQGTQTGILRGVVTTSDKATLPGTVVTIKSPAMQGTREATTETDGTYLFRSIPPGVYTVTFSMSGMKQVEKTATVPLGGVAELSVVMDIAPLTESVQVTAEAPTVLTTPTVGVNIRVTEIDALATRRDLEGIAQISPSVTENTPNSRQLVINGAFAYDNVFMINGVDVDDNLFGSPQNLFIEDAIQETQVLTSGIPAEYGRFSGGVVNAITKSGGNVFSGSFRTNFANPTWSTLTPFDVSKGVKHTSDLNETYEGTFGGPIRRDKVWFFGAGRVANSSTQNTFAETGINHVDVNDNKRGELKLTASPTARDTFQLSYINNHSTVTRTPFSTSIDPHTIFNGSEPNSILGATWRGVLKPNLLAEVGYSQRKFAFLNEGGTSTSLADSPFFTLTQEGGNDQYNAPYFDATDPEHRNNRQVTGNLSYSMAKVGHHDFKGGYEWFRSQDTGGNSQSATNYVYNADFATDTSGTPLYDANGFLIPVFVPFSPDPNAPPATQYLNWIAQRGAVLNVDTQSVFAEDHWAINRMLSADLGVRYEHVRSKATGGILGVNTNTVVPRLAAAFTPKGDGKTVFHVTYGHYAGKYNEAQIGGNNNVANPNLVAAVYVGPPGQGRDFAPGLDPANYIPFFVRFPTLNVSLAPGLSSPITKEFTVSAGQQLTSRGNVQATYVWRRTSNFIEDFIDIANGTTHISEQGVDANATNVVFNNTNVPVRRYQGLVFQGQYRLRTNWMVSGSWTVQLKNEGNFEGEATNQPALTSVFGDYPGANGLPSIYDPTRTYPIGRLQDFQRNRVRLWTVYTFGLRRYGDLSVSGLMRADSGRVFSFAAANVDLTGIQTNLLTAEGYPDSPQTQTLFFGGRGTGQFNGYALLDTSITYDIKTFRTIRPWVKLDVYNVLNNQKLISFNTTVNPDPTSPTDSLGLPTGYIPGARFGQATSASNFPAPFQGQTGGRTFRVAVGVRF